MESNSFNSSVISTNHELNCNNITLPEMVLCMKNPEEMLKPWKINPFFFDIVITHSVAFLFGLIGNGVVVLVMIGDRKSRNATNLFLVSLALADLLLLLVYTPLETLRYFVLQWDEDGAVCKLAKYAELFSASVSVLNLAAVTLERFLVIVFPMKSRSYCTHSNCRRAIIMVWLVSLVLTVPVLYTNDTYPMMFTNLVTNVTLHYCDDKTNVLITLYQFVILLGLPGTLMIICYTFVIRELWKSTRNMHMLTNTVSMKNLSVSSNRRPQTSSNLEEIYQHSMNHNGHVCSSTAASSKIRQLNKTDDVRNARKQVIKMLILVIILFLACWGPRIIMEILIKEEVIPFTPAVYRLRIAFYVLPVVHACVNPFIYSFMSKNFRRSLQRQLERMGCKTCATLHGVGLSHRRDYGSSRSSRAQRDPVTSQKSYQQGMRQKHGRGSSCSSTNYNMDVTKLTDTDNVLNATDV